MACTAIIGSWLRAGSRSLTGRDHPLGAVQELIASQSPLISVNVRMNATLAPRDIEVGRRNARPLDGYPSLAEFIASDPDHTSLVFRRFDKLAARNLLYLQSELAELEAKQVHILLSRPERAVC
jgi:hypothetical protein